MQQKIDLLNQELGETHLKLEKMNDARLKLEVELRRKKELFKDQCLDLDTKRQEAIEDNKQLYEVLGLIFIFLKILSCAKKF